MDPFVLDVKPQWLALACIHVSLQCYGLSVPGSVEGAHTWYEVRTDSAHVLAKLACASLWTETTPRLVLRHSSCLRQHLSLPETASLLGLRQRLFLA